MGVLAILRYPVKAMLGERVAAAAIGAGGVEGDREWVVVDRDSGERIANKRGPTDPRLRASRAPSCCPAASCAVTLPRRHGGDRRAARARAVGPARPSIALTG